MAPQQAKHEEDAALSATVGAMLDSQTQVQVMRSELAEERRLRAKAEAESKAWGHQNIILNPKP